MDYSRYSKAEMDTLPPHSPELRRRVVQFRTDVKLEMHAAIAAKFREIVAQLNSVGHDLREEASSKPGSIDYAEGERPNPIYLCCDTTISAGYRSTSDCDAPPEDEEEWQRQWALADQWEAEWLASKSSEVPKSPAK